MGCTNSVPAVGAPGADEEQSPRAANAAAAAGESTKQKGRASTALVHSNHDGTSSSTEDQTFARDYRIIRHVGGSVSRIYMVVRKHPINQQQSEDLDMYVMQVIDMKSVAPERRDDMRNEVQALKKIHHPNSKY